MDTVRDTSIQRRKNQSLTFADGQNRIITGGQDSSELSMSDSDEEDETDEEDGSDDGLWHGIGGRQNTSKVVHVEIKKRDSKNLLLHVHIMYSILHFALQHCMLRVDAASMA